MVINTHKILARNILKQANSKKIYLINEKRFIWGNIKPDCASKYKFRKHYYDESIDMIINKIECLSKLSVTDIYFSYGKGKFSEELGVVCHFLCDFFCLPHNQRWEFKNAMKKHVIYENALAKVIKNYNQEFYIEFQVDINNTRSFIESNITVYEKEQGYSNDAKFSYYICNSIVNSILNQVLLNEHNQSRRAS